MSFEYERQLTKITHINVGQEKHGDQDVNAMDIDLRWITDNNALAMLSPTLKSSLFEKPDTPQHEVDPDPNHLTSLKHPQMGPLKWDLKYENAHVVVHIGASGKEDVIFGDAKVRKFVIEPKQGGTVVFSYQVRCYPRDGDIEKIAGKLGQEVFVTLDPEGGEAEKDRPDTGKGSNDIAEQMQQGRSRGSKRQLSMVE